MLRRIFQGLAAQALCLLVSFGDRVLVVGILLWLWGAQIYADWALVFSSAGLLERGCAIMPMARMQKRVSEQV